LLDRTALSQGGFFLTVVEAPAFIWERGAMKKLFVVALAAVLVGYPLFLQAQGAVCVRVHNADIAVSIDGCAGAGELVRLYNVNSTLPHIGAPPPVAALPARRTMI